MYLPLNCAVKDYAWGKVGQSSKVATLIGGDIDPNGKYAELWMGTHVNGPSHIKESGQSVKEYLGGPLKYLFKVLSVNQALSIQAHPDKQLAEKLHREQPTIYKDPNHKPEMAIALTPFEVLCSFREIAQIRSLLASVPELAAMVGQPLVSNLSDTESLKALFSAVMRATDASTHVKAMIERVEGKQAAERSELEACILRIHKYYPGDVGNFAPFFLNHFVLQPGEAVFLGPNEPHAYLSGDCIECMAASDNVVRAGLTVKLRDVDTLLSMLTYKCGEPERIYPTKHGEYVVPVDDFQVVSCSKEGPLPVRTGTSIGIVTSGSAQLNDEGKLVSGDVVLIPEGQSPSLSNADAEFSMYVAMIKQ